MTNQLPAFLQALAGTRNLVAEGMQGIGGGGTPSISIRGGRIRTVGSDGTEEMLGTSGMFVVVDANPAVSKTYYDTKYDPNNTVLVLPACFSDNGIAPAAASQRPQSPTCAACPRNVWGSKVSENGKEIKECNDQKKVAVMLADGSDDTVYLLRIPPASLKNWRSMCETVAKVPGVNLNMMAFELGFDEKVTGVLTFRPSGWISEEMAGIILKLDAAATAKVVGIGGPDAAPALAAPKATPAIAAPIAQAPVAAPAEPEAPKRRGRPAAQAPSAAPAPGFVPAFLQGNTAPAPEAPTQGRHGIVENPPGLPADDAMFANLNAALGLSTQ